MTFYVNEYALGGGGEKISHGSYETRKEAESYCNGQPDNEGHELIIDEEPAVKPYVCHKCGGDGYGDRLWDNLYCSYCRGTGDIRVREKLGLCSYPTAFMSSTKKAELQAKADVMFPGIAARRKARQQEDNTDG